MPINALLTYIIAKRLMNEQVSATLSELPERLDAFMRSEEGQAKIFAVGALIAKGAQAGLGIKMPARGKKVKILGIPFVDDLIARFIAGEAQKRLGLGEKQISDEGPYST